MTFRVEPAALRRYAGQLADGRRVADAAGSYVQRHGSFSLHEKGLLGACRFAGRQRAGRRYLRVRASLLGCSSFAHMRRAAESREGT